MNKYEVLLQRSGTVKYSGEFTKALHKKGALLADLAGEKCITVLEFENVPYELEQSIPYAKKIAKGRAQIQSTGKKESS